MTNHLIQCHRPLFSFLSVPSPNRSTHQYCINTSPHSNAYLSVLVLRVTAASFLLVAILQFWFSESVDDTDEGNESETLKQASKTTTRSTSSGTTSRPLGHCDVPRDIIDSLPMSALESDESDSELPNSTNSTQIHPK